MSNIQYTVTSSMRHYFLEAYEVTKENDKSFWVGNKRYNKKSFLLTTCDFDKAKAFVLEKLNESKVDIEKKIAKLERAASGDIYLQTACNGLPKNFTL